MKVVGIDQASHTGFAVLDGSKLTRSGTVVFKGTQGKRLSEFLSWLRELIRTEIPDVVTYEKPHFRGYAATINGSSMIGLIEMVCYESGVPTLAVHSATLKKSAAGYGKAKKGAMTAKANAAMGLNLSVAENNDEADAIHLAIYGGKNFGKQ
jgi:Holliday junction resolvasome RuvABC endonuclease subunit